MKKKLLCFIGVAAMALALGACGSKGGQGGGGDDTPVTPAKQTFTVIFEVDGARYATARVKDGEKITDEIGTPSKVGYSFLGWYEGETLVDLSTYVVTKNVTLTAKFEKNDIPEYNVNDVKQADKEYYLVFGWWECEDPEDPTKKTSGLTVEHVRLFYHNMINYLKTIGATDANIANISFRNYSTATVGEMGEKILADNDVDIMIGVGNNINTMNTETAGGRVPLVGATESLPGGDNSYKFSTKMGSLDASRYVACLYSASDLGKETFSWLKDTKAGPQSFLKVLTQEEINKSLTIDLTVTVHGDTDVTTKLDDKEDIIGMPEITVPTANVFKGFALTQGGEVALAADMDAELTYADVKDLVADDANTLDLYPVIEPVPAQEKKLNVYVQVNGSNLTQPEAELFKARFLSTLAEDESAKIEIINGNASTFTAAVKEAGDADVLVGGNSPVGDPKSFKAFAEGPVANAGAKHFSSTSRKVVILNSLDLKHYEFAKRFYNFVLADAPEYEMHTAFWGNEGTWVTNAEENTMKNGIVNALNTSLKITGTNTLESVYNVKVTNADVAGSAVADLVTATKALRENKGADLVIGCDDSEDGLGAVSKKVIPASKVAAGRQVALVSNNPLAKTVYENYFVAPTDINLTVTVHGDTDAVTYLDEADEVITMPLITVPENHTFEGFALTNGGAVALNVAKDATLKYADVKDLVATDATTLDLYPVFAEIPATINLTVTVHGDTDAVTTLDDLDDVIAMPEITVPAKKLFKGFALTADGEVVLDVAKDAVLKYNDVKNLVATDATTLDLYPIFEDDPAQMFDLFVYVQLNSNVTEGEARLLEARFNATLTHGEKVKVITVQGGQAVFKPDTGNVGADADVLIGANNAVSQFTAHTDGPTSVTGEHHFHAHSRYVMIKDTVAADHLTLAKAFYNFVIEDAPEFEVHISFWQKSDQSWVSDEEKATMVAGMRTSLNSYLYVTGEQTLEDTFNVKFTPISVTPEGGDGVDLYGAATRALRDGKGTDLIIGCGNNVNSTEGTTAGMTIVAKKTISDDAQTFVTATKRYVALVYENVLARAIYENYFVFPAAA